MINEHFKQWFGENYEVQKNGGLRDKGRRRTDTDTIWTEWMKLKRFREGTGTWAPLELEDIEKFIKDEQKRKWPSNEDEEDQPSPKEFITKWLKDHSREWYISPAWKEIKYTALGVATYKDLDNLRVAIMSDIYNGAGHYTADAIKSTLQTMAMHGYQDGLAIVSTNVKYDARYEAIGERWLKAIYEYFKPTESYEIFSTLMKHWAWQVKRKMNDRPVKYHIWLNFFGAAGIGKTTALNKISSPFTDFTSTTSISKLFDDTKEIKRLTENFILIFDEMAVNVESETSGGRLTADQKAILKSIITGDKMDARVYGTQEQAKRRITFSCISSANEHLYDVIYDETTMRRFFDFNCTGTRPKSFDDINKYLDNSIYFWKSIDEDSDDGYFDPDTEVGKQVQAIQASYYPTKTTTKMWADAVNLRIGKTKLESAFRFYTNWCKETGNKGKALQYFARDIQHILPDCTGPNGKIYVDFDDDDAPVSERMMKETKVESSDASVLF